MPSLCTARYVQDYFRNGTLPPEGTTCKPSRDIPGFDGDTIDPILTEEEEELLSNMEGIGSELEFMGRGLHVA